MMRFVTVSDLRRKFKEILKHLSVEKEIVVTSNGRPIALLSDVSESSLDGCIKRARAIQAVQDIQARSVQIGRDRMTLAAIDTEIQVVRRKKRP